jgi:hypothetical protein
VVKDVNGNDLPDWAVKQIRDIIERPRTKTKARKRGLITIIPNGVEPEVWAAQQGLV